MSYSDGLKELHLFGLTKKRFRGDLITVSEYIHGEPIFDNGIFKLADKGTARSNEWKLS